MKTHSVQLSNGLKMPLLGIGCGDDQGQMSVAAAVEAALLRGCRYIDTDISQERDVGDGISAVLDSRKLSRSDIFVSTKLPMTGMRLGQAEAYLRQSLRLLNLEYVDLYLIQHPVGLVGETVDQYDSTNGPGAAQYHNNNNVKSRRSSLVHTRRASLQNENYTVPNGDSYHKPSHQHRRAAWRRSISMHDEHCFIPNQSLPEAIDDDNLKLDLSTDLLAVWKDMERLVKLGLTNSIGVCHFNDRQLTKIIASASIPPAVLQVECHVYLQQRQLRELCHQHNITVVAFGALGVTGPQVPCEGGGQTREVPDLLHEPVVQLVAMRYKRTPAQVLLRFLTQQNIAVIPASTCDTVTQETGNLFNFRLDEVDMAALQSLDRREAGRCHDFKDVFHGYDEHPEYPF